MAKLDPAKLYTDAYDYERLLPNLSWDAPDNTAKYLGVLRLDTILFRKLVLTDAQIVHSRFFINAANERRWADDPLIGEEIPLDRMEIRLRASSLEESLLRMFVDPNKEFMNGHWIPSIDPSKEIMPKMAKYPSKEVTNWRDLITALVKLGVNKADADRLESAWAFWIEKSNEKAIEISNWPKRDEFDFNEELAKQFELETNWFEAGIKTQFCRSLFSRVVNKLSKRNEALLEIENALNSGNLSREVRKEISNIQLWYNNCYNFVACKQHGCGSADLKFLERVYSLDDGDFDFKENEETEIPQERTIKVPMSFLEAIGNMHSNEYKRMIESHSKILNTWYTSQNINLLEKPVNNLLEHIQKHHDLPKPTQYLEKISPKVRFFMNSSVVGSIFSGIGGVLFLENHDSSFAGGAANFGLGAAAGAVGKVGIEVAGKLAGQGVKEKVLNKIDGLSDKGRAHNAIIGRAVAVTGNTSKR